MVSVQNGSLDQYINPKPNTICRLCLKKYDINEFEDLFKVFESRDETIAQYVQNFANIPINREDCFSKVICKNCLRKLNKIEHFKKVILDCNELLKDLYSSYSQVEGQNGVHSDSVVIMFVPKESGTENIDDKKSNEEEVKDDDIIKDCEQNPKKRTSRVINYQCEKCGKFFTHPNTFYSHTRRHKLNVTEQKCKICNKIIRAVGTTAMREHLKRHSQKNRETLCPRCGKILLDPVVLKAHIKAHDGELEFKCDQCPKRYSLKKYLKQHVDYVHGTIKPYSCEICGKTFAVHATWHRHGMVVHARKNPVPCTICDKKFGMPIQLKRHMKAKHGIVESE